MTVSKATADLCLTLLAQVPLTVTAVDFDVMVEQMTKARDELRSVPADEPAEPAEPADEPAEPE